MCLSVINSRDRQLNKMAKIVRIMMILETNRYLDKNRHLARTNRIILRGLQLRAHAENFQGTCPLKIKEIVEMISSL